MNYIVVSLVMIYVQLKSPEEKFIRRAENLVRHVVLSKKGKPLLVDGRHLCDLSPDTLYSRIQDRRKPRH